MAGVVSLKTPFQLGLEGASQSVESNRQIQNDQERHDFTMESLRKKQEQDSNYSRAMGDVIRQLGPDLGDQFADRGPDKILSKPGSMAAQREQEKMRRRQQKLEEYARDAEGIAPEDLDGYMRAIDVELAKEEKYTAINDSISRAQRAMQKGLLGGGGQEGAEGQGAEQDPNVQAAQEILDQITEGVKAGSIPPEALDEFVFTETQNTLARKAETRSRARVAAHADSLLAGEPQSEAEREFMDQVGFLRERIEWDEDYTPKDYYEDLHELRFGPRGRARTSSRSTGTRYGAEMSPWDRAFQAAQDEGDLSLENVQRIYQVLQANPTLQAPPGASRAAEFEGMPQEQAVQRLAQAIQAGDQETAYAILLGQTGDASSAEASQLVLQAKALGGTGGGGEPTIMERQEELRGSREAERSAATTEAAIPKDSPLWKLKPQDLPAIRGALSAYGPWLLDPEREGYENPPEKMSEAEVAQLKELKIVTPEEWQFVMDNGLPEREQAPKPKVPSMLPRRGRR